MKRIVYQSRFCAECGISPGPRGWWQHRYLCAHCAPRLSQRKWFWAALCAGMLLLYILLPTAPRLEAPSPPLSAFNATAPSTGSAQNAAVASLTALEAPVRQSSALFLCGARTKKGTPCKHRVAQSDQRCAQHQGRASILREK